MFCLVFDVLFVRYSRRSRYIYVLESEPEKNQFIYSIPPISPNRAALLKQYLSFVEPPCIDPSLMTVCTQFFFPEQTIYLTLSTYLPCSKTAFLSHCLRFPFCFIVIIGCPLRVSGEIHLLTSRKCSERPSTDSNK